jgi:hypothetical protein
VDRNKGDAGQPQALNRYTYAQNNPVGKVDPDGCQAAMPAPMAGPNALLGLALYHLSQMRSNSAYRDSAVRAIKTLQAITLFSVLAISRPFLVTPLGTILPGGKDVNLVPTGTGSG